MGVTAVNPTTGERVELVNGQWVPVGTAAPAAPHPAAPLTVGTPKPPKPDEPPSGYRWTNGPGSALEPIPGGPADKSAGGQAEPKAQESERTAAYLASNLTANVNLMNQALKVDPSAAKPTWGQWFAGMFGATAKNLVSPEQRQVVENSQKLITDAALTLGTGAAYTKEQLDAYQRGFFPQVGDSEAAIKAKHEALRAALVAARVKAGSQAPQIDAAMQAMGMDPTAPLNAPAPSNDTGGEPQPGVAELNDEQKNAYAAFIAAHNGKPDAGQLKTFLEKLTGKSVPNAEAIAKSLAAGQGYSTTTEDLTYREKVNKRIADENRLGLGDDPVTVEAKQGSELSLSDEAAGVGNALANVVTSPFTGKLDFGGSYRFGRDVERQRIENAREQLGYGGTAIELITGAAAAGPGRFIGPLNPLGAARQAGRAGAAGGALTGFGSGDGAENSVAGGTVGALAGYGLGRYGGAVLNKAGALMPRRFRAPQGMAPDVAAAADAEGVDLIRPMVDDAARSDYGALESNVYSMPIIRGAAGRVQGQIEDRALSLGKGGTALEPGVAGERLQIAGNRYVTRSRGIANRLYDRAANLSQGSTVQPAKAVSAIDAELADLKALPNVNDAEIRFMEELRNDLTQGPLSVDTLRNLRTSIRGRIGTQNLTLTQAEARAARVLDAASEDITSAVSPEAASAYRRADAFYRERQVMVDDLKRSILGKPSDALDPQKAFANLKSLTSPGANGRRLGAVMRHLEPDERQDIAATVAQSLGRAAPDMPFELQKFLDQTKNLSQSARKTVFGPDGAQSIANLRLLTKKLQEAGKDINHSRSTTVLERQGIRSAARNVISTLAGLASAGAIGAGHTVEGVVGLGVAGAAMGATATRKVLSARAMVNPKVSRWLAESADVSTPAQAKEATRKLGVIIAREPAIANELQPIYQMLQERLTLPLAAEPQAQDQE